MKKLQVMMIFDTGKSGTFLFSEEECLNLFNQDDTVGDVGFEAFDLEDNNPWSFDLDHVVFFRVLGRPEDWA